MNCKHCNAPLVENARFCPQCGKPVSEKPATSPFPSAPPLTPLVQTDEQADRAERGEGAMTAFPPNPPLTPRIQELETPEALYVPPATESRPVPPRTDPPMLPPGTPLVRPLEPAWPPTQPMISAPPMSPMPQPPQHRPPTSPPSALAFYQAQGQGVKTPAVVTNARGTARGRNRRRGCVPGCLIALVLLVILAGAGWVFALRPYVRSLAIAQLDQAMTNQVNQIPTLVSIPAGTFRVTDSELDNLVAQNVTSSSPVQQLQAHFTPSGLRLDFQVYGLPATITGVPTASQGQLVLTNVTLSGVIAPVLSPNDLATLFNQHFATALTRIHHTVKSVTLKDQEMDLVLG
jgi:hypothetical protein